MVKELYTERKTIMKKIISVLLVLSLIPCLFACGSSEGIKLKKDDIKDVVEIEMSVRDYGVIELELYHDVAPITVENFVSLVCDGFYDGLKFHRVVNGFMIQGGDPKGNGTGGSENTIKGEFALNGFNNTLSHERGVISMARSSQSYDSASSQFFICHDSETCAQLDGQYAAFGKVVEGMDIVDDIAEVTVVFNSYGTEKSVPSVDIFIDYVIVTGTHDRDGDDAADGNTMDTKSEEELYADPIKVEMSIEDHGIITLELYPNLAPITVQNFVDLANDGYYDGADFHRIIEDFMIQGGAGDGSAKTIKGEFTTNGVYNPLKHERGVISMARTNVPDSASSQFFIVHEDSPHLNGQYAAFGKVIEGIEVVDSVAEVDTDSSDAPLDEVIIEYVKVLGETEGTSTPADDTTAAVK